MNYIKRYPLSVIVAIAVIYLSLFNPPSISFTKKIVGFDKYAHVCMYLGFSGMIWVEYLRTHKRDFEFKKIAPKAIILPILFSGTMELLQEYCTTNRSGDWFDLAANSVGVTLAALIGYFILRPMIIKNESQQ